MTEHHNGHAPWGAAAPAQNTQNADRFTATDSSAKHVLSGASKSALQHSPPQKGESPLAGGQFAEQGTNKHILSEPTHEDKRFRSLQAKLALLSHKLQRTQVEGESGHHYWISRWNHAIELRNLDQVDDFLALVGGTHGI